MPTKLNSQEISQMMEKLDGWELASDEQSISKSFKFKDFSECWGFMARCALIAETIGHHPEWSNVYNQLNIKLTTHDVGDALSDKDADFAKAVDAL